MEKLISGIHNYCDRWCERCAFTTRCAVGIEETKITDKERDITNIEFWNSLSENFEKTFLLLEKAAKFHGIDLNEVSKQNEDEYLKREKSRQKIRDNQFLFKGGTEYANRVHKWLDKKSALKRKGEEIVGFVEMGIKSEEAARNEINNLQECMEVVNWYSLQISVKFARAISGKEEGDDWFEENNFAKDSDGSAKVALLGIDRSISAWTQIYEHFPEREDEILTMLSMLDKLRRIGEEEFPNARKFKRPGFDD